MGRIPQFLVLVLVSTALVYFFVILQWGFVTSPAQLFATISGLVSLSFMASAIEAGLTVADRDGVVFLKVTEEMERVGQKFEAFAQRDPASFSRKEIGAYQKLLREMRYLRLKRDAFSDIARDEHAGAFSALGTIFSIAVAALITGALTVPSSAPKYLEVSLPVLDLMPGGAVNMSMKLVDLTSVSAFTLVVATLPTLLFGKIVPKMIGRRFPVVFAYHLYPVAYWVHLVLGWLPAGAKWPFSYLLRPKQG